MSALKPVKVGLVGCGMIAIRSYMPTILRQYSFIDVVKCADSVPERAQLFEQKFGCKATTVEDIMNDPEIEIVLNLTYPTSHLAITKMALEHGKHCHTEKMAGVSWEDGLELLKLAEECEKKGIWYTQAPDTWLGGAWQTARQIIDSGFIGDPLGAFALVTRGNMILGAERGKSTRRELPKQEGEEDMFARFGALLPGYNPRTPAGSGLPFDMGGYYLHNLINLLGNINRVSGYIKTNIKFDESKDPLNEKYKSMIDNHEPDTLVGSLEFDNGCYGSIMFLSGYKQSDTALTIYGSEANLVCPDPNFYGGKVFIQKNQRKNMMDLMVPGEGIQPMDMYQVPFTHGIIDEGRGVGLLDLAFAIRNGRKPRCHYSMGMQSFEVVHGLIDSCANGVNHKMVTKVEQPKAVKPGVYNGFECQCVFDD
jgi:predicted dehydrogenase